MKWYNINYSGNRLLFMKIKIIYNYTERVWFMDMYNLLTLENKFSIIQFLVGTSCHFDVS